MKPRLEAAARARVTERVSLEPGPKRKPRPQKRRFAEIETPDPATMPRPDGTPAEMTEEAEATK